MRQIIFTCLTATAVAQALTETELTLDEKKIELAVKKQFNGVSWTQIQDSAKNPKVAKDFAKKMTSGIEDYFSTSLTQLPDVCQSGTQCRQGVQGSTRIDVNAHWLDAFARVARLMEGTVTRSQNVFNLTQEQVKKCEPGCFCDKIMTEYNQIFTLEKEVKKEIAELETTLDELRQKEKDVLTTCPQYESVVFDNVQNSIYTKSITTSSFGTTGDSEVIMKDGYSTKNTVAAAANFVDGNSATTNNSGSGSNHKKTSSSSSSSYSMYLDPLTGEWVEQDPSSQKMAVSDSWGSSSSSTSSSKTTTSSSYDYDSATGKWISSNEEPFSFDFTDFQSSSWQ